MAAFVGVVIVYQTNKKEHTRETIGVFMQVLFALESLIMSLLLNTQSILSINELISLDLSLVSR